MYTTKDLENEIDKLILDRMERREPIDPEWVTMEVMRSHLKRKHVKRDTNFQTCCSWYFTREKAGVRIARATKKPPRSDEAQFTFAGVGFVHIQPYYVVSRDEVDVGIPVLDKSNAPGLSYDEMTALGQGMSGSGETRIEHGREVLALRDMLYPMERRRA